MKKFLTTLMSLSLIVFILLLCELKNEPAISSDKIPTPVTDELLKKLGLDREYHRCISVADGDTLTLEDLGTVRFVGVDTPEKNHPKLPIQFMSQEAGKFTRELCLGKKVRLEYDSYDEDKRGKYGRVLGYLYLEDGTLVQEGLLKRGYAIAYTKYPMDEGRKQNFANIEKEAIGKGIGLWKDDGLSEVEWILGRNYPMLQISYIGNKHWSLRYWKYILEPVPFNKLEDRATELYSWIYELNSRDLNKQLIESGYKINSNTSLNSKSFYLFGMAHKKWGILYDNLAYPRIQPGELDDKCEEILNIMNELVKKGFRLISGNYNLTPKPIHAESDCPASTLKKSNHPVICWDQASQYIGKKVTVIGKVTRTFKNDKVCFLNFHNNYTKYLNIVLFSSKFKYFPKNPDKYYLGKTIYVSGKIKKYEGRPEIIIEKPDQIKIVN